MSEPGILSDDEVSALLEGVGSGNLGASEPPAAPGEVRAYDLVSNDRIMRGRLPALEMVNERFVRLWRNGLYNMLQCSVAPTSDGIVMVRFNEYINSLPAPANINLIRVKPLRGMALLVMEPTLVFGLVDNFFGGGGRFQAPLDGREFAAADMRMINLIIGQIFSGMTEAWAPTMKLEFEYLKSETNPHFANVVPPHEYMVISKFRIELEGGGGGEMHLGYPWSTLEPFRDVLSATTQGNRPDRDEKWSRALRSRVFDTSVEPLAVLAEIQTTLGQLANLKAGDILPLTISDPMPLSIGGVPVFLGRFGNSNGKCAVKITEVVRQPTSEQGQHPASAS